jgi:hypothetical protein
MIFMPRTFFSRLPIVFALSLFSAHAEQWEIGGAAAYALTRDARIERAGASATAGLQKTAAFSAYASHREKRWFGGDFWYTFRPGSLQLKSGATQVQFSSVSHLVHYDISIHPKRGSARLDPYFAAGGGIRVLRGTGRESAFQPLNNFAVLSRTQEVLPLLSLAAGVRFQLSRHSSIRFEIRDNISPFPGKVIFVNRQATAANWWHDITPQVGFGVTF